MAEANKGVDTKVADGGLDVKTIQKNHAKKGTKIKLNDRVELKVLKDFGGYKEGQRVRPHAIYAEELVAKKVARVVTEDELAAEKKAKYGNKAD